MRQRSFGLWYGLMASLLLLSTVQVKSQSLFNKTLLLDKNNARQVLGFSTNNAILSINATQDATGISAFVWTGTEYFSYGYDGDRWRNQISPNLVYDTGIHPAYPVVNIQSGRDALISSDRYSSDPFNTLYISDGTTARSVFRNADLGNVSLQNLFVSALSFNNGNLALAVNNGFTSENYSLLYKEGNSPLRQLNSTYLSDPRGTHFIENINSIVPTVRGFAVHATSAEGETVYEYRDGGLVPLFDAEMDYFGDGDLSQFHSLAPSAAPQDGLLFRYDHQGQSGSGYGLYRKGSFNKIAHSGQELPNNAGKILYVTNGWLDNGEVVVSAVIYNPDTAVEETVLLLYRNGHLNVIDRYILPNSLSGQITINGFVNGSFLATVPDPSVSYGSQVFRYTLNAAVPEPGSVALMTASVLCGMGLWRVGCKKH